MYSVYEVKQNETLESIANDLNITIEQLIKLNGNLDNLKQGQLIVIPTKVNYSTYLAKKGDTLYSISKKYNIDIKSLELINGFKEDEYLYVEQEVLIPNNKIYVTKENDNLIEIIEKLNISFDKLTSLNDTLILKEDQIIFYND